MILNKRGQLSQNHAMCHGAACRTVAVAAGGVAVGLTLILTFAEEEHVVYTLRPPSVQLLPHTASHLQRRAAAGGLSSAHATRAAATRAKRAPSSADGACTAGPFYGDIERRGELERAVRRS